MTSPQTSESVSPAPESPDLKGAVAQAINLGLKDPVEIARKVISLYGLHWLQTELLALGEDIVAELARHQLGARRRTTAASIKPGQPMTSAEMKLVGAWVPHNGRQVWKALAEFTAEDHDARAQYFERVALGVLRNATWHREVAQMMRAEGVKTTGAMKADLPPLPAFDALELPPAPEEA